MQRGNNGKWHILNMKLISSINCTNAKHTTLANGYRHDVFDCGAYLVGQLSRDGSEGMLQIDASPVETIWLRHCSRHTVVYARPNV